MLQRLFRGRRGRSAAERDAMRNLYRRPPAVRFDAHGEIQVVTRLEHVGAKSESDWKLRVSVEGVSGSQLEKMVVARVVLEVSGGSRLVFRTLRQAPFEISAIDAPRRHAGANRLSLDCNCLDFTSCPSDICNISVRSLLKTIHK